MAEHTSLFDDNASSHPLDLLINAISGSGDYNLPDGRDVYRDGDVELDLDGLLGSTEAAHEPRVGEKRPLDDGGESSTPRESKVAKTLYSHLVLAAANKHASRSNSTRPPTTFSTVEMWHPTLGQKSYGKERRLLNPPPILRVSGPLLPLLTSATLSTVQATLDNPTLSSQTHHIPLTYTQPTDPANPSSRARTKVAREEQERRLREAATRSGFGATLPSEREKVVAWEREALREGLSFPGLYIGESVGKNKEFELHLALGEPGVDVKAEPFYPVKAQRISSANKASQDVGGASIADPNHATLGTARSPPKQIEQDQKAITSEAQQESSHADDLIDPELRRLLYPDQHTNDKPTTLVDHLEAVEKPEVVTAPASISDVQETAAAPVPIETNLAKADDPLPPPPPWVTFKSSSLNIVSKPSQKTAKARSMESCLSPDDSFCLWVRINSQTVRTKYMKVESGDTPHLSSRTGQWTPFRFEVTHPAAPAESESVKSKTRFRPSTDYSDRILTYGSVGVLLDLQSGVRSEPMIIVRTEKNEALVGEDVGHPVSELQRIGLVKAQGYEAYEAGGARWYLSAPGARLGGGELLKNASSSVSEETKSLKHVVPETLDGATTAETRAAPTGPDMVSSDGLLRPKKRKKTKRHALAQAVVAEADEGGSNTWLCWHKSRRSQRDVYVNTGKEVLRKTQIVEELEDWNCWVLGGVSSFSYSFFDTKAGFASLPSGGIEPIPRVLSDPIFNADLNSLDIVLSDFYYLDSAGKPEPLDIHLGPIGPLATRPWRSTAPSRHRFDRVQICEAVPFDDHAELSAANAPLSSFPSSLPHVLVVVQMPSPEQILRTMQECSAQVNPFEAHEDSGGATSRSRDDTSQGAIGVDAWLSGTNEGAREPDNSASHGPQTVIRALAEEQPDPSPAADMSDIATVLGVHAGSDFAFLASPSVDQALVDPALIAEPEAGGRSGTLSAPPLADVATGTSGPGADAVTEADNVDMSDQPVHLVARQRDGEKSEMVPLPLVLVRRSDGVGFGVGRSVEAERLNGDVDGKPQWGLRLVPS